MTTAEIESLLERVRRATEPDRELDNLIVDALGIVQMTPHDVIVGSEAINVLAGRTYMSPAPLTASIDACLALIERMLSGKDGGPLLYARKIEWAASAQPGYLATLHVAFGDPADPQTFWAQAATEPLALLATLLLALLHQASDKGMIDG